MIRKTQSIATGVNADHNWTDDVEIVDVELKISVVSHERFWCILFEFIDRVDLQN